MGIGKHIDAWITEDDDLFIGFPSGKPPFAGIQAAARAREVLSEWEYEIAPSYVEIRNLSRVLYVHAEAYDLEHWPAESVHEEPGVGLIEVWVVDIAALDHHRDCE